MGIFAAWLQGQRTMAGSSSGLAYGLLAAAARACSPWQPGELDLRRTLVVADFHPTRDLLLQYLGGLPACVAVPQIPTDPLPGVVTLLTTAGQPLTWTTPAHLHVDTVACLLPWRQLEVATLQHWRGNGIKYCWFLREGQVVRLTPWWAWLAKKVEPFCPRRQPPRPTQEILARTPPMRPSRSARERPRITHYVATGQPHESDPQVWVAALAQKRAGYAVRVVHEGPALENRGPWRAALHEADIPISQAGVSWQERFPQAWADRGISTSILSTLPADLHEAVIDLAAELLLEPTDVLHAWGERASTVGLVAGLLAGVPAMVLGLRSLQTAAMPGCWASWLRLAHFRDGVSLVANSHAGAREHERRLDTPTGTIPVIRDGFLPALPTGDRLSCRQKLGLQPTTPVLAGIFPLEPRQRPRFFLQVIARLHRLVPEVCVLLAGAGSLESWVKKEIRRRRLEGVIQLLGQRDDWTEVLAASDVLLHVAEGESVPPVVLAAQDLGCIPLVCDEGGLREAIEAGFTGLLRDKHDLAGLVRDATALLQDGERRTAMAQVGRLLVRERFDVRQMNRHYLQLYGQLLATPHGEQRGAA